MFSIDPIPFIPVIADPVSADYCLFLHRLSGVNHVAVLYSKLTFSAVGGDRGVIGVHGVMSVGNATC